ncbi:MAG: sulfatase [Myxococcales bacterium]|nr:sulfatase [Myxococcales bacterium]
MRRARAFARVAAVALSFAAAGCGDADRGTDRAPARPPSVVLVTIESLRTDHVGAYGGRSATRPDVAITPTLDALAAEAVTYERAHSVTSWTLASHASLFTGLYPAAHQTQRPRGSLGEGYDTLAEVLARAGYQTAGVVSGPYLRRMHGLVQGIEWLDEAPAGVVPARAHSDVTNPAMERGLIEFVELRRDAERPFFLFAYFWDPHFDFLPPAPYDAMFVDDGVERIDVHDFDTSDTIHPGISEAELDFVLSQYDGEIRATDELLGRFFSLLRARGLWDDALVIVTADHGEEFFDHGQKGHKNNLYAETVHVPLFVKYPRGTGPAAGTRDARLASLVDVAPTVLDVAGVPRALRPDVPLDGRSLLAPPDPARAIFLELLSTWYLQRGSRVDVDVERFWAAMRGDEKLVVHEPRLGRPRRELYDVAADPRETRDLASDPSHAAGVAALGRALDAQQAAAREVAARFAAGSDAQLDPEDEQRLRELGYL